MPLLLLLLAAAPAAPAPAAPPPPPAPLPLECRVSNGVEVCGYHCVVHPKGAQCARTPEGLCTVLDGEVLCWDPPEEVRLHLDAARGATPQCKSKYGTRACGYLCTSSPTKLDCTQSPWGACKTHFDDLLCWDPPQATIHTFANDLSGVQCVATQMGIACGWNCRTAYQQAACAQTPEGRCSVYQGKVQCVDPPLPPIAHVATAAVPGR
jgi:hypothetical protein